MEFTENQIWEFLVEHDIATDEEISLVTDIAGYSVETLENIIYARTGLHDMEQLLEELGLTEEDVD